MTNKNSYQKISSVDVESSVQHEKPLASRTLSNLTWIVGLGLLFFGGYYLYFFAVPAKHHGTSTQEFNGFDNLGRYVMTNFDMRKPMASFLPGLGGIWGIPMWTFYVNRGQAICAFGIQNKDGAISKYNTAEKAYQQTPFTGFRTFLKGTVNGKQWTHMPFFPELGSSFVERPERNMKIGYNEVEIEEIDTINHIKTDILYYNVPSETFPCLVRKTTFTNLDTKNKLDLEILDGLAKIEPSGLSNYVLDAMGRTMEAWMNVYNINDELTHTKPFYHISQGTADTATVQIINDGFFAISYIEQNDNNSDGDYKAPDLLPFIVDPTVVFGLDTVMGRPHNFFDIHEVTANDLVNQHQCTTSRTPCAYAAAQVSLKPGANVTITSYYGHAPDIDTFIDKYIPLLTSEKYSDRKRAEASELIDDITSIVETNTSSYVFNSYVKQNFLDNTLRGGLPYFHKGKKVEDQKCIHVYSRIHGDIERDYNSYQIDTTYFSQGPGNFRDVSQNRRSEPLHSPELFDFNIRMFLSFVQSDGYNPLTVAGTLFRARNVNTIIHKLNVPASNVTALTKILSSAFRLGSFFHQVTSQNIRTPLSNDQIVSVLLDNSDQFSAAQYAPGQGGFWADHWTYTLDHVHSFLEIFPDKEEYMLWDSTPVPFFMSPAVVRTRNQKYTLVLDSNTATGSTTFIPMSVYQWGDAQFPVERMNALMDIYSDPSYNADTAGAGAIWQRSVANVPFTVTTVAKLSMLGILKFSTMDPFGMGIEMEGGKPGWNDAMNGLPGLQGSGMPETYEMLRIIRYVHQAVLKYPARTIQFPVEFSDFLNKIIDTLNIYFSSDKDQQDDFNCWDSMNTAREHYRAELVATFKGDTVAWDSSQLDNLFTLIERKTQIGINKAVAGRDGLSPTYFYYECTDYKVTDTNYSTPIITPLEFAQHSLPLFLEGSVRYMKVLDDVDAKRDVFQLTKDSNVYDSALKMYLISESMKGVRQDIGRMMAFSPGWLENESVWLHMSYKFYLELIRGGLYSEFFNEIATGLVPFMDYDVYGRSPLEAGSFIVSSAFPDAKLHGQSFLARLSGSTAEFISMWSIMMMGPEPFSLDSNDKLVLSLRPVLPSWMFYEDGTLSFVFLGKVPVTYHNPLKADTWTIEPTSAVVVANNGSTFTSVGSVLPSPLAYLVRDEGVASIDIYFENSN